MALVPTAGEGLSYGVPCFRVDGKLVAGFSAAAKHLSYLPHSGTVLSALDPSALEGYRWSKGALNFAPDAPLPQELVALLIRSRLKEIGKA